MSRHMISLGVLREASNVLGGIQIVDYLLHREESAASELSSMMHSNAVRLGTTPLTPVHDVDTLFEWQTLFVTDDPVIQRAFHYHLNVARLNGYTMTLVQRLPGFVGCASVVHLRKPVAA